jgi:GNAT superfamily N-acetyltransferase
MVSITTIQCEADILATLALQRENLRQNVPIDEQILDGFVTIEHQFDLLSKMNDAAQTIIAKNSDAELVGYALTMLPEFAPLISELTLLFSWIKRLEYNGKPLQDYAYYVLGQVCVKKHYRGQGIFRQMLLKHREMYSHHYQLLITSISSKNKSSLHAHVAIGFEIIHSFHDPIIDETWHIVLWDWKK